MAWFTTSDSAKEDARPASMQGTLSQKTTEAARDLIQGLGQVKPDQAALLRYLKTCWPEVDFRYQLTRSGWHRPGGLMTADQQILTRDPELWLQQQLEQQGSFENLLCQLEQQPLLVFNLDGSTHFFVANYGDRPEQSWQLEVEELQEMMTRCLLSQHAGLFSESDVSSDDTMPDDLQDLLEPVTPAILPARPLGDARYQPGHLMNISEAIEQSVNKDDLHRFCDEWRLSVTPESGFYQYWFFQRHESRIGPGIQQLRLYPKAIQAISLKAFNWQLDTNAQDMARQLRQFDRIAGYSGAWYFCMVAGNLVPRELPTRLQDDWLDEYRYISERQARLVRNWLHKPYTL
ncbi:hypothetical protein [Oceanospirillum sediminis]|uniref:Uncharacterized protein n=1 Tax=Oceanospirillum sediminis TaxID=2760088 RepID=A0A839IM44_9GAMM|nr:hypothetical protein [Oceanospirillum sediminis]MBB1486473.1 hypothetical protein [Oceanospirillum sediminis]